MEYSLETPVFLIKMSGDLESIKLDSETDAESEVKVCLGVQNYGGCVEFKPFQHLV